MSDSTHSFPDLSPELLRLMLVLIITLASHLIARHLLRQAERITARTDNILDDSLIAAAKKPLPVLIWLTGIFFALHLVHLQTNEPLLAHIAQMQIISAVICLAWFLFGLIRQVSDNTIAASSQRGEDIDRTTVDGFSKLARIVVVVVSALVVLQTLGFSISGLVAFGGVGGLAVGLAARDMLANLFGGLMLHLDRPFSVGEVIRSPDRQIEGKVEQISWRHTLIRAPNMSMLYVPNSLFTSIVVENPSRMSNRRLDQIIGLRYGDIDKIEGIVADVSTLLAKHPEIDKDKQIIVSFDAFADSSLNLLVRAFTHTTDLAAFQAIKQELLLEVARIVASHGAEMAFQTRTVYMHQGSA
jgi:MscS family membrane protein